MGTIVATSYVEDGTMRDTPDVSDEVITNRAVWLKKYSLSIDDAVLVKISYADPNQDYCRYREVTNEDKGAGMFNSQTEPVDGLVTKEKGLVLFLPISDCVATTLYDETLGLLMLTHLGRHSLEQQGGVKSVQYLHENYGVDPATLKVWLSATVNKDVYKIYKLDNKGLKEAVYEQLLATGILHENIIDTVDDSATDPRYFSHSEFLKGNKPTDGRFAMLAVMTD